MTTGYEDLEGVLHEALLQASAGKGKERHAKDNAFARQPILEIGRMVGVGFETGQAIKKTQEAVGMLSRQQSDRAIAELLGGINYLAAAIILIREQTTSASASGLSSAQHVMAKDIAAEKTDIIDELSEKLGKSHRTFKTVGDVDVPLSIGDPCYVIGVPRKGQVKNVYTNRNLYVTWPDGSFKVCKPDEVIYAREARLLREKPTEQTAKIEFAVGDMVLVPGETEPAKIERFSGTGTAHVVWTTPDKPTASRFVTVSDLKRADAGSGVLG